MNTATAFVLCGTLVVGLGLYGLITNPQPLRKIVAFNLLGSGVFMIFGVATRRGAAAGFSGDPVPQALVITGLVVAFAATALAVALLLRLYEATGSSSRSSCRSAAWCSPSSWVAAGSSVSRCSRSWSVAASPSRSLSPCCG